VPSQSALHDAWHFAAQSAFEVAPSVLAEHSASQCPPQSAEHCPEHVKCGGSASHLALHVPWQDPLHSALSAPLHCPEHDVARSALQMSEKSAPVQVDVQSALPRNSQPPSSCVVSARAEDEWKKTMPASAPAAKKLATKDLRI